MSGAKSWSLPGGSARTTRRRPLRRRRRVTQRSVSVSEVTPIRGKKSTGLFRVPSGEGNAIELVVYLSSFSTQPQTVQLGINRVVDDSLQTLFYQTLEVAAGEARKVNVFDVENETIEVTVATASNDIVPSAAVVQTFLADGATVTLTYKSPADFVRV